MANKYGTLGLILVEDAAQHRPPGLLVKEIGEALRLIAVDDDLGILNQMWDALLLQNALRQFRERNSNEGVQLLSELKVLVFAPGGDDAAGANVEPNGRSGLRVGVCHL